MAYSKDLSGVILVVGDAAVADSPLRHHRVETGIRDRVATTAAGRLRAGEGVDRGVTVMFLLELFVTSAAHVEIDASHYPANDNDANYYTSGNTGRVGSRTAARITGIGCSRNGGSCGGYDATN